MATIIIGRRGETRVKLPRGLALALRADTPAPARREIKVSKQAEKFRDFYDCDIFATSNTP
jgi:hypothetical protein